MKIILTLKSRNEESNVANAIESYVDWVDEILLADGGSTDRTVQIAERYRKVSVRPFRLGYYREDGSFRNHEGHHLNFLFKWAELRAADWIIHDDCDCVLNKHLRENARTLIESTQEETIHTTRLYVYGKDMHFAKMSYINDSWQPSLWAWKTSSGLRCENVKRHFTVGMVEKFSKRLLYPPYCILHKFAPSEEVITRKVNDYKLEAPTAVHPKVIYGEPEPLPEWAIE